MNKEVVIARYKEDLSWIWQNFNEESDVSRFTIYEKFYVKDSFTNPFRRYQTKYVTLPNVGYEAHTYLWHIYKNYDELADITYFVQGNPFDHYPRFLDALEYGHGIFGPLKFISISDSMTTTDATGQPHHPTNPIPVAEYYEEIFGQKMPEVLRFGIGGQFAVKRQAVHQWPREFYGKLLRMSEREMPKYDSHTCTAMIFERLWESIFCEYRRK